MAKIKCKCGHGRDVHAPLYLQEIYDGDRRKDACDGECCVQYPGKDGFLKACYCMRFEDA